MKLAKLGYFGEFLIFPPLILISTAFAFYGSPAPRPMVWIIVYCAGVAAWTLIEYLLHRIFFHRLPFFSQMHERHHGNPKELFGTPVWASVSLGLVAVACPSWAVLGFDLATATTAGLTTGYLWYVLVHYMTHHSQPRHGSYFYRMWLRHAQHHYISENGNFGVTTSLWDVAFGTALEPSRPARKPD